MRSVHDRYVFEKFLQHKVYPKAVDGTDKMVRGFCRRRITELRKRASYEKLLEFKKKFRIENKLSEDAAIRMLEQWISMVESIRGWGYQHRYECVLDAFQLIKIESEASRMSEKRMEKALFLMQV